MQKIKRYRPEEIPAAKPPSDMEKNIASLRMIRKSRLDRKEAEYRKMVNKLNTAKSDLDAAATAIDDIKRSTTEEKQILQEKNLSALTTQSNLQRWFDRENQLDDLVIDATYRKKNEIKRVLEIEREVKDAKAVYQKALLGIEKLDILQHELSLANED